jgi:hypothetical protein
MYGTCELLSYTRLELGVMLPRTRTDIYVKINVVLFVDSRPTLLCTVQREIKYAYEILVGKPERKRSLRRPRRIWDNNIKMYLKGNDRRLWAGVI